jgi:hypothetical protein
MARAWGTGKSGTELDPSVEATVRAILEAGQGALIDTPGSLPAARGRESPPRDTGTPQGEMQTAGCTVAPPSSDTQAGQAERHARVVESESRQNSFLLNLIKEKEREMLHQKSSHSTEISKLQVQVERHKLKSGALECVIQQQAVTEREKGEIESRFRSQKHELFTLAESHECMAARLDDLLASRASFKAEIEEQSEGRIERIASHYRGAFAIYRLHLERRARDGGAIACKKCSSSWQPQSSIGQP